MSTEGKVKRHKTAIKRYELSAPIKALIRDGLLDERKSVFDYGCGRGSDIRILNRRGFQCSGWDPAFCPAKPKVESDIVNLGYVINVIEDPEERSETLAQAWELSRKLLVVSSLTPVSYTHLTLPTKA